MEFGYALPSEEHTPRALLRYARQAEEAGFSFALLFADGPKSARRAGPIGDGRIDVAADAKGVETFAGERGGDKPRSELVTEAQIAQKVVCGPDAEACCDPVCFHQIGPDQNGFFKFYAREVLPRVQVAANA